MRIEEVDWFGIASMDDFRHTRHDPDRRRSEYSIPGNLAQRILCLVEIDLCCSSLQRIMTRIFLIEEVYLSRDAFRDAYEADGADPHFQRPPKVHRPKHSVRGLHFEAFAHS